MKNKIIITVLSILLVVLIALTTTGYFYSKKEKKPDIIDKTPIVENTIKYEYYLEDEKIDYIPANAVSTSEDVIAEQKFIFKKFNCDNNIMGKFDTTKWEFIPNIEKNGTCKLYFVNAKYEITLSTTNAQEDPTNNKFIEREKDGEFKIIPNEGYEFKEAICGNSKEAIWNEKTNTLKINAITSDIACTIHFEKKELKINIEVKNGKGNTTEKVLYGDNKTIIIEPNEGYNNPSIKCTNEQTATYNNNNLNFEKVTNDTTCQITFNKTKINNYNLTIENINEFENIKPLIGSSINQVNEGKDVKITLQSLDDKLPNLICEDDIIPIVDTFDDNKTRDFLFYNVTKDITCKISIE